ncbi:MAG: molybdopterin-guanine dinucleotide biosynthesis protein A [Myxococcota bacterium]
MEATILVGGRSSRFGSPKTEIRIGNERLLGRTVRIAREALGTPPRVIGQDLRPGQGPLGGIETALTGAPGPYMILLACDLPGLSVELLQALRDAPPADVVLPVTDRRHPLCARWAISTLAAVSAALDREERAIQRLLTTVHTHELDATALAAAGVDVERALFNVNSPDDLQRFLA